MKEITNQIGKEAIGKPKNIAVFTTLKHIQPKNVLGIKKNLRIK